MNNSLKYRLLTAVLIAVFVVFNIGLPIVLASCPMLKAGALKSCCAENRSNTPVQNIGRTMSSDCCKTVIAGERNTNEFVQSQVQVQYVPSLDFVLPSTFSLHNTTTISMGSALFSMPPSTPEDIPVATSSLRI